MCVTFFFFFLGEWQTYDWSLCILEFASFFLWRMKELPWVCNVILEWYEMHTWTFQDLTWDVYDMQIWKKILLLLIGGCFWSLQVKAPRILGGQSKKIEKFYKFSQKSETSGHHFGNSYYSHWICYLFSNKLSTFAIMKIY